MALRDEWRRDGVAVTLLNPGFVESDIRRTDNAGQAHERARDPAPAWIVVGADRAARAMIRAIDRRARERGITVHGKLMIWLCRHLPWLVHAVLRLAAAERSKRVAGDGIRD
jgi:short-subunit dehydrogenase